MVSAKYREFVKKNICLRAENENFVGGTFQYVEKIMF